MKSTIITTVLCAVPLLVEAGSLSNHGHHKSLLTFRHKRHAALTPSQKLTMIKKKRSSLLARKIPGTGDSTDEPSNLAQGSYTSKQGCAVWHTVADGEVCLGLIDKSSAGFDLNKFLTFNPSLNDQCSNLEVGQAYCVDTVVGQTAAPAKTQKTTEVAQKAAEPKSLLSSGDKSAPQSDAGDDEDCEEDDEASADEDDEDCEEDDSESQDTVISVKTKASTKVAAPQSSPDEVYEAPKEATKAKQAPKDTYVAPKSSSTYVEPSSTYVAPSSTYEAPKETYVAPSSTYVAPSSTYQAPKETSSPEPEQAQNNGGSFQYTNQPATYYYQNGNPGSCGDYSKDSDYVVAVKSGIMGSELCGKSILLKNVATGKEVTATIKDTCPTCNNDGIDLSEGLFKALVPGGDLGVGMFNVDYKIL